MLTDEFAQLRQDSILQMHKILEKVDAVKVNIFLLAAFLFVLYVGDVLNITFRVVWVTFKMLIVAPVVRSLHVGGFAEHSGLVLQILVQKDVWEGLKWISQKSRWKLCLLSWSSYGLGF